MRIAGQQKLCARAVPKPWLPRNRMSESFTYGSVGVAGYSHWSYGDRGEGPPLPGSRTNCSAALRNLPLMLGVLHREC